MAETFIFGKLAQGALFTNRSKDLEKLSGNLENNINTILISPRRWGKSSLVKKTCTSLVKKGYKVCQIDLFKCRNEEDFYTMFAKSVISATASKVEGWVALSKEFLKNLKPQISVANTMNNELDLSLTYGGKRDIEEILNLPERIAKKKKIKIIICIDEFQNLEYFENNLEFQKILRAVWQHHEHVTYCLYGSKRHIMTSLFKKRSMPFYKFGDLFFLEKIEQNELASFIQSRFSKSKKVISKELALQIPELMECHPYYTQQLAYYIWLDTEKECTQQNVDAGVEEMLTRNQILFQQEYENLTNLQLNFIKALASGVSSGFGKKQVIQKYNLSSTAAINRVIQALEKKEIIDRFTGKIEFVDPGFRLWVKREFP